ncbi:MAG: hypothetical protein UX62_C0056G0004 [Microgenomates group bacterium GW2011_GWA2_46_7]|nr:MAG: hypothetical protein UX62_C0056G0004 [Microgenomates group bacterium GW2011_GWA2_46_7]
MDFKLPTDNVDNYGEKGGKNMTILGGKRGKVSFPPNCIVIPKVVHELFHGFYPRVIPQSTAPTTATTLIINCL